MLIILKFISFKTYSCIFRISYKTLNLCHADKSGKITVENLKQASRLCGVKLNEQEIKEMIEEADKDGDNEVDADEFLSVMMKTNLFS